MPQGVPREDRLRRGGGRLTTDHRFTELEELIVRLIAERDAAIQRQRELELRNQELERQNAEMARKLSFYEGPNVPPSVMTLKKKKEKTPSGKKRGAPKGHRGATRSVPPPEAVVDVSATQCPRCHQDPGEPVGTETKVVEDIIPPRELTVKALCLFTCNNFRFLVRARTLKRLPT